MLKMNNITKTFNSGTVDERVALDHLSLTLRDGDFATVIGGIGPKLSANVLSSAAPVGVQSSPCTLPP